jgi:hypothetical protein
MHCAAGKLTEIQLAQYKTFASPFAKVFLGAIFTYQVIYWTWLKLEMDEFKFEKNRKLRSLALLSAMVHPPLTTSRRGRDPREER